VPCRRVVGAGHLLDGVGRTEGEASIAGADLRIGGAAWAGAHADETRGVAPGGGMAAARCQWQRRAWARERARGGREVSVPLPTRVLYRARKAN
jgi:hypothetical protein